MKHAMMIKPAASIPLKDCFELFVLSGVKANNSCVGKAYGFCLSHAPGVKIWRTPGAATMPAPSDCMKSMVFGNCVHSLVF